LTENCERFFDLLLASLGLIILLPLCVVISVAIKLDSDGPIFFFQKRIGKGCKPFHIWKFRTMVSDPIGNERNANSFQPAQPDDPRITKVGLILRRAHLDELPQLINILKGDMSLVGVRPDLPVQSSFYSAEDWGNRHKFRPGITGLAQISLEANLHLDFRLELDKKWSDENSLRLYFTCLGKTVRKILRNDGV